MTYDPLNIIVGARLAMVRKSLKLSQETVCGMSGMKQTTLSTIESGRGGIRLTNLLLLCGIYGKTVSELLTELEVELAGYPSLQEEVAQSTQSENMQEQDQSQPAEVESTEGTEPEWKIET